MVMTPFMKALSEISTIRKTMTVLPIVGKQVNVAPLVVGDDLALRTSLTSPVFYDRELVKLIHHRSEFLDDEGTTNFNKFCKVTSNIDKLSLLWALFKSTYETLGKRKFTCPNKNCSHSKKPFEIEVLLDDIVHEDTYTMWEESEPFYKFSVQIDIPYDNIIYSFQSRLPSIENNNRILSTMSNEALQHNLENLGSVYSRAQNMALLVTAIQLSGKDGFEPVQTENLQEILSAFETYVPYKVSEDFIIKYNEIFDKYLPKFYKKAVCPECGEEVTSDFDLEVEFFRRSLFGAGESE